MQINHPSRASNLYERGGDIRTGRGGGAESLSTKDRAARELLWGEENSPGNYRLGYSESLGGNGNEWMTPRHHHNFEQIRHPLEGDYSIGKDEVLPAGWVAYFPESAYYGPQVMSPNLRMFVAQFGGPSGHGFYSTEQLRKAFDELSQGKGKFENGMYTWEDPDGTRHNQDAFEALWEQMYGEKVVYPEARYDRLILMNPANFNWTKDSDAPGIARKNLGVFTEREIRIGFVQMDTKASFSFGYEPSNEFVVVKQGAIDLDGTDHPSLTAIGTSAKDKPVTITANEDTELFYVKLPTF